MITAALLASACGAASDPEPEPEPVLPETADKAPAETCAADGRLETTLYGAVEGDIKWQTGEMSCEGMPRPDGAGARLRFAGPHPSGSGSLVFIAAIPDMKPGETAGELTTRLTVIEEGQSRFFTSPDFDICWADVERNERVEDEVHSVGGRIYCITPINAVNGSATLSVADILFSGHIDWNAS